MMPDYPHNSMLSIHDRLAQRSRLTPLTYGLLGLNLLIFLAMLVDGAGFGHFPNDVQLKWGANFGPATQDGEWWRLFTAMFLHFGVMHLLLNSVSLWDVGQLVERMYGHIRFISIYLIAGLCGNLFSLVVHGNSAVSGGASGAIFGIYGAALIYLWRERAVIEASEFKWLFGGGSAFAVLTIVMGFIIPGIDNAAHVGGLITGMLMSIALNQSLAAPAVRLRIRWLAVAGLLATCVLLVYHLPKPKYRWSEELLLRNQIHAFLYQNQAIQRSWLEIMEDTKQGNPSFSALASQIDFLIRKPYQASLERLSKLPRDPALPSAQQLEGLVEYTRMREQESEALVNDLRKQQNHSVP